MALAQFSALFFRLAVCVDSHSRWIQLTEFKAAVQPKGDNPWAITPVLPKNIEISSIPADDPENSVANSEFAIKISSYLAGLDLAASIFHSWDDFPAMHRRIRTTNGGTRIDFIPKHHRLTIFGLIMFSALKQPGTKGDTMNRHLFSTSRSRKTRLNGWAASTGAPAMTGQ